MTSGEALKDAMRNCVSYIKNATATTALEPALNAIIETTDLAAKYDDAKTEIRSYNEQIFQCCKITPLVNL